MSAAEKKAVSERMTAYWAERRRTHGLPPVPGAVIAEHLAVVASSQRPGAGAPTALRPRCTAFTAARTPGIPPGPRRARPSGSRRLSPGVRFHRHRSAHALPPASDWAPGLDPR